MKLTMSTEVLKDMVAKSVKGVGNDKLLPLTTKMAIELKNNVLTLISTDYTNYLYIKSDKVKGDDFYIVVESEKFSKLISKLTCDKVTLQVDDSALTVIGNGTYKIEIPLDESTGEFITFPDPASKLELKEEDVTEVNLSTLKLVLESCKPSLAVTFEDPQYTGYYIGERVITTNRETVAGLDNRLLQDNKVLVYPQFMELVNVLTAEKVSVYVFDDNVVIATPDCSIYSKVMEGIEDFEVDTISGLLDTEMENICSVNKSDLLSVLDRVSLFVGQYDNSAIKLSFTKDGLEVTSVKSDSAEVIPYSKKTKSGEFTCYIDAKLFNTQVKAYSNDVIDIEYGDESAIKLVDGDLVLLVCLLDDDEITEG